MHGDIPIIKLLPVEPTGSHDEFTTICDLPKKSVVCLKGTLKRPLPLLCWVMIGCVSSSIFCGLELGIVLTILPHNAHTHIHTHTHFFFSITTAEESTCIFFY